MKEKERERENKDIRFHGIPVFQIRDKIRASRVTVIPENMLRSNSEVMKIEKKAR